MQRPLTLSVMLLAIFLAGCSTTSYTGSHYSRDQVRQSQQVLYGTVVQIRPVTIEGTNTVVGAGTGAALGGIAGNQVGGGSGKAAATIVGAVVGGAVGSRAEEALTRKEGIELTIQLDNGSTIAYVQEVEPQVSFRVGQRVRVLTVDGTSRVTP